MSQKLKKSLSALLLINSLVGIVGAQQVIEGAEKTHVQVNVSANEANRLAIDGRRIVSIVPSVKGAISGQKDDFGGFYFTLASDSANQGTVTLFVSDDKGITYKLLLIPRAIAGEEIILKPATPKNSVAPKSEGRTNTYQRRIKDLLLMMADEGLKDVAIEPIYVGKEVPLWKEVTLTFVSRYMDGELVGEKYQMKNISPSQLVLSEQELYRRGVLAVSIGNHVLSPGDVTDVWVIRERKENE